MVETCTIILRRGGKVSVWLSGAVALTGTVIAMYCLLPLLRTGALDVPNHRSSHATPVPRAGGVPILLGLIAGLSAFWAADGTFGLPLAVCMALVILALVGLFDDLRPLGVRVRLLIQGTSAGLLLTAFDPTWWSAIILWIFVVGQTNATNFMDGINGITGLWYLVSSSWYATLFFELGRPDMTALATVSAFAVTGFLIWNLQGLVFLGDIGSYLLGGLSAFMAVSAWTAGSSPVMALAPLSIGIVDTTSTLVLRLYARKPLGVPHREHAYQLWATHLGSHLRMASVYVLFTGLICAICLGATYVHSALLATIPAVWGAYVWIPRRKSVK